MAKLLHPFCLNVPEGRKIPSVFFRVFLLVFTFQSAHFERKNCFFNRLILPLIPKIAPLILLYSQLLLGAPLSVKKLHFTIVLLKYIYLIFMGEIIKTIIVEDDTVNIKLLKLLLKKYCPEIEIVGIAKNAKQFIRLYFEHLPSLIFLDIHLGGKENALSVLNEIPSLDAEVIITSADATHAMVAINDYQVAGYILKPVGVFALKKVIATATHNLRMKRAVRNSIAGLSEQLIAISTAKTIEFVMVRDILYLEAEGKYTLFHLTNGDSKVVSKNIGEYEKILPQQVFYRIHHKFIVNLQKVQNINKTEGSYCQLVNGISLTIAKRRHDLLRKFLNI